MKNRFYSLFVLIILFMFLFACAEKSDFKKTKEMNTIESYEKFLKEYPKSKYVSEAKGLILKLKAEILKLKAEMETRIIEIFDKYKKEILVCLIIKKEVHENSKKTIKSLSIGDRDKAFLAIQKNKEAFQLFQECIITVKAKITKEIEDKKISLEEWEIQTLWSNYINKLQEE